MTKDRKWKTISYAITMMSAGFVIGIAVQQALDKDRNLELESLRDESITCGHISYEHSELENMLAGKDERIGDLLKEIEGLNSHARKDLTRFQCLADLEFVEAEWNACVDSMFMDTGVIQ